MGTLNLTLLDNAHSFVNEALSKAIIAETDPRQWQFAIFALVQAIELALKERLRREYPALIFKNIDDRKHTVTLEQAAARLRELAKITITEADLSAIRTATHWRNLVVHYEFEFAIETLKPVFAKLLGFLTDFHKSNLGLFLADYVHGENWKEAVNITEYGAELYKRARTRFELEHIDNKLIWICPHCGNDAFVVQDKIDTCYVCNFEASVIACDECEELIFAGEAEEVTTDVGGDREILKHLCSQCFESLIGGIDEPYDDTN
jgi:rubrerythrin